MLLTFSLQRLQVQLNDVTSEIFFLNVCKVGEYLISFGTEFPILLHLYDTVVNPYILYCGSAVLNSEFLK